MTNLDSDVVSLGYWMSDTGGGTNKSMLSRSKF